MSETNKTTDTASAETSQETLGAAKVEHILDELRETFERVDYADLETVIPLLESANRIVCAGVGREGLTCRAFCMRLMHLGYDSHWVWDDTAPALHEGDVFFFTCGSGEIAHLLTIAELAKRTGATVICVTGVPDSDAANLADEVIFIPASVYKGSGDLVPTTQPMGTLWETASWILLDAIIYELHERNGITYPDMAARHRNYE
ncbi:SIS domain-containing protein [Bifidobacterium saguinibicoloris]|uniref:SIS domain-containing protein n=1 Tax=Bifidobacterium saguinibicoloris TaxID=2834433 RepID=UPI001C5A4D52|nr:SIS domain-containing protein [Bifidobacterium saguinibicoloris]MBW3081352.1 SIS domain-containing protein [Bifidobacterium saguinibicoloris]